MKICSVCQHCYEDTTTFCAQDGCGNLLESRIGTCLIAEKYCLNVLLEQSAASEIYQAVEINSDKIVNLIALNLSDADLQSREFVHSEIQIVAGINHPSVQTVRDYGVLANNDFYVVTEFTNNQTLANYLENTGSLTEATAVMIARQIAEGLDAAHSAGAIHRSINPANLIVIRDKQGYPSIKIQNFDFGGLRQQAVTASILEGAPDLGALQYFSPEQCVRQTVDARTDIYSLGVVFYEMLSGSSPFNAPTAKAIVQKHLTEQPLLLDHLRFDVKALLTHTLMRSLNKSPGLRPQTAVSFARNLRHLEYITKQSAGFSPKKTIALSDNKSMFVTENDSEKVGQAESDNSLAERNHLLLSPFAKPFYSSSLNGLPFSAEITAERSEETASPVFNLEQIPAHHELAITAFASEVIRVKRKTVKTIPFTSESVIFRQKGNGTSSAVVAPAPDTAISPFRAEKNIETLSQQNALSAADSFAVSDLPKRDFAAGRRSLTINVALLALLTTLTALGAFFINRQWQQSAPEQSNATAPVSDSSPPAATPEKTITATNNDAVGNIVQSNPRAVPATTEKQSADIPDDVIRNRSREETLSNNVKAKLNAVSKNERAANQSLPEAATKNDDNQPLHQVASNGDAQAELNTSLNKWINATNARDVDQQMSYYAPKVNAYYLARNASQEAVRSEKKRVFESAAEVDIQASKPEIDLSNDGQTAKMRFRKKYVIKKGERNRTGEVLQELQWVKSRTGWKIVSERDLKVINNR